VRGLVGKFALVALASARPGCDQVAGGRRLFAITTALTSCAGHSVGVHRHLISLPLLLFR
jgi:hypothetical protein